MNSRLERLQQLNESAIEDLRILRANGGSEVGIKAVRKRITDLDRKICDERQTALDV